MANKAKEIVLNLCSLKWRSYGNYMIKLLFFCYYTGRKLLCHFRVQPHNTTRMWPWPAPCTSPRQQSCRWGHRLISVELYSNQAICRIVNSNNRNDLLLMLGKRWGREDLSNVTRGDEHLSLYRWTLLLSWWALNNELLYYINYGGAYIGIRRRTA